MKSKYDTIGVDYNTTRKADNYISQRISSLLKPIKGKKYLDIGCGTGNYTSAIFNKNYKIVGIDPSSEMLSKARLNNSHIEWSQAMAENTELESSSIDGMMASLTLHHWNDINAGFLELARILKPGSRMVIFTSTKTQMKGYWLNHYFPKMMIDSIAQMPEYNEIIQAIESAGFAISETENYHVKNDLEDLFLYCGKQRPELYLDEKVRHGISSFSSLSNASEVKEGLLKITADIKSGEIQRLIDTYENQHGDYLFIVGIKQ